MRTTPPRSTTRVSGRRAVGHVPAVRALSTVIAALRLRDVSRSASASNQQARARRWAHAVHAGFWVCLHCCVKTLRRAPQCRPQGHGMPEMSLDPSFLSVNPVMQESSSSPLASTSSPKGMNVAPTLIYVGPVGRNINVVGFNVVPALISIAPVYESAVYGWQDTQRLASQNSHAPAQRLRRPRNKIWRPGHRPGDMRAGGFFWGGNRVQRPCDTACPCSTACHDQGFWSRARSAVWQPFKSDPGT